MKKSNMLYAVLIIAVSFTACKKKEGIGVEKSSNQYEFATDKITFKIPPLSSTGVTYNLAFIRHRLNLDQLYSKVNANYTRKNLKSVTLQSCFLNVVSISEQTSFGRFSAISMEALGDGGYFVGSLNNIKDSASLFTLSIPNNENLNIIPVIVNDTVTYRLSGKPRKPIMDTIEYTVEFIYNVKTVEYQ